MEINIPQNVKHKQEIKVTIKETAIQYGWFEEREIDIL